MTQKLSIRIVMFAALFAAAAGCVSEPPPSADSAELDGVDRPEPARATSEDRSAQFIFRCSEPDFTCTTATRCGAPPEALSESCGPNLYCCFIP